jgi:hypothetical protein
MDYDQLKKKIYNTEQGKEIVYYTGRFCADLMGKCAVKDMEHERFTSWCRFKSGIGEFAFYSRKISNGVYDYIAKRIR